MAKGYAGLTAPKDGLKLLRDGCMTAKRWPACHYLARLLTERPDLERYEGESIEVAIQLCRLETEPTNPCKKLLSLQ